MCEWALHPASRHEEARTRCPAMNLTAAASVGRATTHGSRRHLHDLVRSPMFPIFSLRFPDALALATGHARLLMPVDRITSQPLPPRLHGHPPACRPPTESLPSPTNGRPGAHSPAGSRAPASRMDGGWLVPLPSSRTWEPPRSPKRFTFSTEANGNSVGYGYATSPVSWPVLLKDQAIAVGILERGKASPRRILPRAMKVDAAGAEHLVSLVDLVDANC